MTSAFPPRDPEAVHAHVEMLHLLAEPFTGRGKLVVASYGEDPLKGREIVPKICHFAIGDVDAMVRKIIDLNSERHRNVYVPLAVMRADLPDGKKGSEADVIATLGLVEDFDDDNASAWLDRLPVPPDLVLETSAGRFQTFFLSDQPELANAKVLAEKLKGFAQCDHGSADLSHVWRVPGTLNWPNAKKVQAGRSTEPQAVRVFEAWDGSITAFADLEEILADVPAAPRPAPQSNGHDRSSGEAVDITDLLAELPTRVLERLQAPATGVDRSKALFYVISKLCELHFDDTDIARTLLAFPNGVVAKYDKRADLGAEIARIRSKTAARRLAKGKPGQYDQPVDPAAVLDEIKRDEQTLAKLIDAFNTGYMVVNEAGKVWVCQWRTDPNIDREVLDYIRHAEFRKLYENRFLSVIQAAGKTITKTHADWWLESPSRKQYLGGVCFDPTGHAPKDYLNLWRGFAIAPAPGNWSLLRNHIVYVLCSGEPKYAEYLLNWLARLVQYPHLPGEVALVLRGLKGSGKGTLARWIEALFGRHGLAIINAAHLVGHFNEHLRDLVFLFADEAFFAGDRQHEGVLKGLITSLFLPIEGKYKPVNSSKNMLHLFMASNQEWVVPTSHDERRYFVLDVPDTYCRNLPYFAAIEHQMTNGGLAAMLDELLNRDISQFEVRDVPRTPGLDQQTLLSLPSVERWWLAVLSRGYLWKSRHGANYFRQWHEFYSTELLARSYLQWCEENRPFDRKSREYVGRFMTKLYSPKRPAGSYPIYELDTIDRHAVETDTKYDTDGKPYVFTVSKSLDEISIVQQDRPYGFTVGDLEAARARFLDIYDIPAEWTAI
jgi:hypothetical protein